MKKIMVTLATIFLVGCTQPTKVVLMPSSTYYPVFDTSDFNVSNKYKIELQEETEDINGTTETYLIADEKDALGFIKNTKELRKKYNLLLNNINKFNKKIILLNEQQRKQKPKEIK